MVATRKPVILDLSGPQGKCPEPDVYTLAFDRVEDYGLSTPFENEEPKMQFTLVFTLEYPDPDDEEGFDGMEITGWYTPKFKAIPGRIVPKLYTLLTVLNGGEYVAPESNTVVVDKDGNEKPAFDGWLELEKFVGRRFRSAIAPSAKGWARLKGDPMPLKKGKKAVGVETIRVITPEDEDAADGRF